MKKRLIGLIVLAISLYCCCYVRRQKSNLSSKKRQDEDESKDENENKHNEYQYEEMSNEDEDEADEEEDDETYEEEMKDNTKDNDSSNEINNPEEIDVISEYKNETQKQSFISQDNIEKQGKNLQGQKKDKRDVQNEMDQPIKSKNQTETLKISNEDSFSEENQDETSNDISESQQHLYSEDTDKNQLTETTGSKQLHGDNNYIEKDQKENKDSPKLDETIENTYELNENRENEIHQQEIEEFSQEDIEKDNENKEEQEQMENIHLQEKEMNEFDQEKEEDKIKEPEEKEKKYQDDIQENENVNDEKIQESEEQKEKEIEHRDDIQKQEENEYENENEDNEKIQESEQMREEPYQETESEEDIREAEEQIFDQEIQGNEYNQDIIQDTKEESEEENEEQENIENFSEDFDVRNEKNNIEENQEDKNKSIEEEQMDEESFSNEDEEIYEDNEYNDENNEEYSIEEKEEEENQKEESEQENFATDSFYQEEKEENYMKNKNYNQDIEKEEEEKQYETEQEENQIKQIFEQGDFSKFSSGAELKKSMGKYAFVFYPTSSEINLQILGPNGFEKHQNAQNVTDLSDGPIGEYTIEATLSRARPEITYTSHVELREDGVHPDVITATFSSVVHTLTRADKPVALSNIEYNIDNSTIQTSTDTEGQVRSVLPGGTAHLQVRKNGRKIIDRTVPIPYPSKTTSLDDVVENKSRQVQTVDSPESSYGTIDFIGRDVLFLADNSRSMRGNRISTVRNHLMKEYKRLNHSSIQSAFAVWNTSISYHNGIHFVSDMPSFRRWISRISPTGKTRMEHAITQAMAKFHQVHRKYPDEVVVLCDGDTGHLEEHWEDLYNSKFDGVVFHFVAIGTDAKHAEMGQMASVTGGTFVGV
eukprot:gb/GECH01013057.1/.p1 GENE.gb/GECH01013057.1/~~gb/GECH01013057.1/.p1  ORF type:complete len:881 (+),score=356.09 gb/GECH01013057.1/:1-2643(+)